MPVFLAPLLLKLPAIKAFIKSNAVWLFALALATALIGSSYFLYTRGHSAGQQEVQVQVERQHTETIREVRSDEQLAQHVADTVGTGLANTIGQQKAETDQQLKEIHDALTAMPAAPAGCPAVVVPDGVRASSNSLVDRANRAADAADATR